MPVITLWINAFIPRTVAGYTQVLSVGPHAGKTAIPLPSIARTWPGNWSKDLDCGYLTDQRSFDGATGASVRMQSLAEIELGGPVLIRQAHRSSGTTEVNLGTGNQTGHAVAAMSRCRFTLGAPSGPPGGFGAHLAVARGGVSYPALLHAVAGTVLPFRVEVRGAAGDPLVGMAADIDYVGTFAIAGIGPPGQFSVSFQGLIDDFPAFECYAAYNGVTKELFRSDPPPGHTVANLLGPANRPISGSVRFP